MAKDLRPVIVEEGKRVLRRILPRPARATLHQTKTLLTKWHRAAHTEYLYRQLAEPKTKVPPKAGQAETLVAKLQASQIPFGEYKIDTTGFTAYLERARYNLMPEYYGGGTAKNFTEKALEHYVAAELLALSPEDVYCDVASDASPTPTIYKSLFGCTTYRQDLSYPPGLNGNTIGGDAARMPIPDGFFSKAALHCSFEHFEGDADTRFIHEAARILKPGGRMCIAPLYLSETYHILTDLNVLDSVKEFPREDALVFHREKWGNRFGRQYDVAHLSRRVFAHAKDLKVTVFHITNAKEINPSCYLTFALILEKQS